LLSAINRNRPKVALAMINNGATIDAPIIEGVGQISHRELAEALIRRKYRIFTGEGIGSTLLHGAACSRNAAFFDWTAANTPDVNTRNKEGSTPLHFAVQCAIAPSVEKLLARGADVNAKNARGTAPINNVFGHSDGVIVTMLLNAGANPDNVEDGGNTPLITAVLSGNTMLARALIRHRADANLKNRWGTALHEAARRNDLQMAEVILAAEGVRVNELNDKGETALHIAARSGTPKLFALLVERGADPSIRTPSGKTAGELGAGLDRPVLRDR
jgi:ankyrin repeat protein